MKPGIIYRGEFQNIEQAAAQTIRIDITDTETLIDDDADETIIDLELSDTPLVLDIIDDNETKNGIKSKRVTIGVHTSSELGIYNFASGGDNRFYVEITNPDTPFIIFVGWLSISDLSQDFQPDPNVLSLIATDGLGFMSDEQLTDENGNLFQGENPILNYIQACLSKTGLSLRFNAVYNIRESSMVVRDSDPSDEGHFLKHVYLNAKTFETDIGEADDARTAMEKIMGKICTLFQHDGEWWLVIIDELEYSSIMRVTKWYETGEFVYNTVVEPSKTIGDGEALSWMNDDAVVSTERPVKEVSLKYLYETPKEIPCNSEFARGTGPDITGAANETIDYEPECWEFLREAVDNIDLDSAPVVGSVGVLRKRYEYGYEKERYLVTQQAGGFRHYFKSSAIQMDNQSKISLSVNWWMNGNLGDVNVNLIHVRFIGNSGTIYDLNRPAGADNATWSQKLATDPVFADVVQVSASGVDTTENQQASVTTPPVPEAGFLYIRLINDLNSPTQRYFSGLEVDYIALVNGSYQTYTGQVNTVTQEGSYKALIEDQVYISDAPSVNHKGALLIRGDNIEAYSGLASFGNSNDIQIDGDVRSSFEIGKRYQVTGSASNNIEFTVVSKSYSIIGDLTTIVGNATTTLEVDADVIIGAVVFVLPTSFYSAQVFPTGPPDITYTHPFGYLQVFDVWNQHNRVMYKFEGTIDGLDTGSDPPDMMHKYFLSDIDNATNNKVFAPVHISRQDFHLCEWQGFFHELYDNTIAKQYTGHSFKYTSQDE